MRKIPHDFPLRNFLHVVLHDLQVPYLALLGRVRFFKKGEKGEGGLGFKHTYTLRY